MYVKAVSLLNNKTLAEFSNFYFPHSDRVMIDAKELSIDLAVDLSDNKSVWNMFIEDSDLFNIIDFPQIPLPSDPSEVSLYVNFLNKHYDAILLPLSLKREVALRIAKAIHINKLRVVTILVTASGTAIPDHILPLFDFLIRTKDSRPLSVGDGIFCLVKDRQKNKTWLEARDLRNSIEKLLRTENCFSKRDDWGHGDISEYPRLTIEAFDNGVSLMDIVSAVRNDYKDEVKASKEQILSDDQARKLINKLMSATSPPPSMQYNVFYQAINTEIKKMTRDIVKNNQGITVVGKNKVSDVNLIQDKMHNDESKNNLASALEALRKHMKVESTTADHDMSVGYIAQAEGSVKNNDPSSSIRHLKSAGKWALDIAEKFSIDAAIEVLKSALDS